MSNVLTCLHVIKSTGLPITEIVLEDKAYNQLLWEIQQSQRVEESEVKFNQLNDIWVLGIKILQQSKLYLETTRLLKPKPDYRLPEDFFVKEEDPPK